MIEKEKVQKQFGLRLKTLRNKANMSQESLADCCGLDRTYISGLERGIRNPSLTCIFRLAIGLNIQAEELIKEFDLEYINEIN